MVKTYIYPAPRTALSSGRFLLKNGEIAPSSIIALIKRFKLLHFLYKFELILLCKLYQNCALTPSESVYKMEKHCNLLVIFCEICYH